MSEIKTIDWQSDRACHYVLSKLNDMKMNISKMFIEDVIGEDLGEEDTLSENTVIYNNEAVDGLFPGYPSKLSVDATIALMMSYGDFPIPEEIRKYLVDVFEQGLIKDDSFPVSDDIYEKGRAILDAFIESGLPYYSACALTGATFVECGWNVHVYNSTEASGGGVGGTSDWSGCGEGLFGLTFWTQKEKMIKTLGYNHTYRIPDTQGKYNDNRATHLCDLDEEQWIEMAKEYLKNTAKKDYEVLSNEDAPQSDDDLIEILSASYLWKAACGLDPTWDNVKETTLKYQNTHKKMHGESSVHDGFGTQICISIALDKYLHDEKVVDMHDIGLDISFDISTSGKVDASKKPKPNKYFGNGGGGANTSSSQSRKGNGPKTVANGDQIDERGTDIDNKFILPEGFDPSKGSTEDIILEVKRGKQFTHQGMVAVYGKLFVNGQYWCDTAERNIVAPGMYKVAWRSEQGCTKTGRSDWVRKAESGNINYKFALYSNKYVPLVLNTVGLDGRQKTGIRIHEGTSVGWSEGCLVVGKMNQYGNGLTNTWESWKSLYDYCRDCKTCKIIYTNV